MARHRSNSLTIEQLPDGKFRLFGFIDAMNTQGLWSYTKIRRWSPDLTALQKVKTDLEQAAADRAQGLKNAGQTFRSTTITNLDDQHDCEEALRRVRVLMPGRTLVYCVEQIHKLLGSGAPVKCDVALERWKKDMEQRRLSEKYAKGAIWRIQAFLDAAKPATLQEITHGKANEWVLRSDSAPGNQVNDAVVLNTWLKQCVEWDLLKQNPLKFKLSDMSKRAAEERDPKILTPEQCQRLLDCALAEDDGKMALYVVLGLWAFLRPTELPRLRPGDFITKNGKILIDHRGKKKGSDWRLSTIPDNVAPLVRKLIKAGAVKDDVKDEAGKIVERGGVYFSRRTWIRIRVAAGFGELLHRGDAQDNLIFKPGTNTWTSDVLRHTGMSYLFQRLFNEHVAKGSNENAAIWQATQDVTKQAGNSARTAFTHYLLRVSDHACDTFFAIRLTGQPAPVAEVVDFKQAVG